MAKTIPAVGEPFLGDNPYAMKVMKFKCGFSSDSGLDVEIDSSGDSDSTVVQEIVVMPPGAIIHSLGWLVETAFVAGSSITIGDTDSAGGFAAATDVGCTTADTDWGSPFAVLGDTDLWAVDDMVPYAFGKVYGSEAHSSGLAINLTYITGTTVWAGVLDVFVVYSMAGTGVDHAT